MHNQRSASNINGAIMACSCARALMAMTLVALLGTTCSAQEPLHTRMDQLVAAGFGGQEPAALADDATFLRRIWLDLTGRIPSADEARKFIADTAPEKRTRMIDQLLAAPTYARRMEDLFRLRHQVAVARARAEPNVPAQQSVGRDARSTGAETYRLALERRLSAEQLLDSMLRATGTLQVSGNEASDEEEYQKLRVTFEKTFGNDPREPEVDIQATVSGALYLLNSNDFLELFQPRSGSLVQRLSEENDLNLLADELYLSVFTRRPTDEARDELAAYLENTSTSRSVALKHLAWAMLTSMEFYVNH